LEEGGKKMSMERNMKREIEVSCCSCGARQVAGGKGNSGDFEMYCMRCFLIVLSAGGGARVV
jgi:hypothetical protein